jgi:hypothetical protein
VAECIELVGHRQNLLAASGGFVQASTHLREVTKETLRLDRRGVVRPAALNELRNAHVEMETDFIVHLGHGAIGTPDRKAEETTDAGTNHDNR